MYDLIIIGSGPAGLGAAVYGKRAGLSTLVVEKSPMSGGQVLTTYEVDNYLGLPGINGFDLGTKFREHADTMGAEFTEAEVESIEDGKEYKTVHTTAGDFKGRALILSMGAHHAKLNVAGEEKLQGMGVSYCATCDGAFFKNRTVAVVGGGDVALEDTVFLARTCAKVYLIHRRDTFRAAGVLQEAVKNLSNVEILYNTTVQEICGEDMVEKLILQRDGCKEELPVNGIFIAVGIHPDTEICKQLVNCDEAGYILAGEDTLTDKPGIFAAGDIRKKPLRQIITAVADGANAASSAAAYLAETMLTN